MKNGDAWGHTYHKINFPQPDATITFQLAYLLKNHYS